MRSSVLSLLLLVFLRTAASRADTPGAIEPDASGTIKGTYRRGDSLQCKGQLVFAPDVAWVDASARELEARGFSPAFVRKHMAATGVDTMQIRYAAYGHAISWSGDVYWRMRVGEYSTELRDYVWVQVEGDSMVQRHEVSGICIAHDPVVRIPRPSALAILRSMLASYGPPREVRTAYGDPEGHHGNVSHLFMSASAGTRYAWVCVEDGSTRLLWHGVPNHR